MSQIGGVTKIKKPINISYNNITNKKNYQPNNLQQTISNYTEYTEYVDVDEKTKKKTTIYMKETPVNSLNISSKKIHQKKFGSSDMLDSDY